MGKILKFHTVASSVNDTNIASYVNMDFITYWVTAATTVTIFMKGKDVDQLYDDTITITTDGIASTKLVADGLAAMTNDAGPLVKGVCAVGAGFNGAAITTITAVTTA
jgi:hypothetical protein